MDSSTAFDTAASDEDLDAIVSLLSSTRGLDFTLYRRSTLRRRVIRRMERAKMQTIAAYVQFMRDWPAEIDALSQDMLGQVTHFFRDPEAFEVLKAQVYPALFRDRTLGNPIRVWVPGCSTGEEAYSVAVSLVEALFEWQLRIPIQIFATDVSEAVVATARAGLYSDDLALHVTQQRRLRYFTSQGERWRINRSIQQMCVFARQNVMADPPFSRLDLISCRNLLIQCEPSIKERILPTFYYALKPTGALLLGAPCKATDLFTVIDADHGIYTKANPVAWGSEDANEDWFPGGREPRGEHHHLVVEIAHELQKTQESMQGFIDDQDATNADLQETNADLVTSNEELQSLNEELQAIAEELRATNEDLSAMNEMLERRNDDLSRFTEELTNVLTSLKLPIMTLSRDLRLRCLTAEAKRVLELSRADVGRTLGELKLRIDVPDLERVVAEMLDKGSRREREVKLGDGRSYSMRILPYRTEERRIEGVVLLFVDIDARKANNTEPGA